MLWKYAKEWGELMWDGAQAQLNYTRATFLMLMLQTVSRIWTYIIVLSQEKCLAVIIC